MIKKIAIFCSLLLLIFLFDCDNEPYEGDIIFEDNSCMLVIQNTSNAFTSYNLSSEDDFMLFCQIYREALENQIEICGDEDGSLQLIIDDLGNCTINNNLCDDAITITQFAQNSYNASTSENFEDSCNTYRNALEYQIEVCGDDGFLQNLINELDNCELEVFDVVGTWKLVSWNTDELRDLDNDSVVTNNYLDDMNCFDNETILFNSDGTGIMFLRSSVEFSYTPTANGEDFFVNCTDISIDKPFNWTETINSVTLAFTDGTSMSLFKNGGLYIAIDDAFYAESTVDNSVITERITFVYEKI